MQTTNDNIIQEIISTAKLAIAGASEFELGDSVQVFSELYLQPLFKKMEQGIKEMKQASHKELKELVCTIKAVELELQRIKNL